MDDYNTSMLSEAKNEYCIRLLNVLTPMVIEGLKSILKTLENNSKKVRRVASFLLKITLKLFRRFTAISLNIIFDTPSAMNFSKKNS